MKKSIKRVNDETFSPGPRVYIAKALIKEERRRGVTKEELALKFKDQRNKLYVAALSVTKNAQDAEDAVSNAFLRALKHADKLDIGQNVDAWLVKTVMNEAKRLRSSQRYYENIDDLYDAFEDDGRAEKNVVFFDMLSSAGLNFKCRRIFVLRFLYGYTLEEIAGVTGAPLSSVKSEYYRGLEKIKKTEGIK